MIYPYRTLQKETTLSPSTSWSTMTNFMIIFLILLFTGSLSSESCDAESCANDPSKEGKSECGCSVNREKTEGSNSEAVADDVNSKYSTHSNLQSPYPRTNEMVEIPAGSFVMGTNKPIFVADGEGPERKVTLSNFYLDKYEVSNAEFELFVNSTGYVTEVSGLT